MNFFKWLFSLFVEKPSVNQNVNINTGDSSVKNKYAVLVGINKYQMPGNDLRGCVNDTENMWKLLTEVYDFDPDNIRVLNDERAIKSMILERLDWLVKVGNSDDLKFFHDSSHGSFVRDRSGDELDDNVDECIIPYDHDWDDALIDDILADYLKRLQEGTKCVVIVDACHSASMTRAMCENPHPALPKFLPPPFDIEARSKGRMLNLNRFGLKKNCSRVIENNVTYLNQNHILLSGCRDNQTSADCFIDGQYQGALTANLIKLVRSNPKATWLELHKELLSKMQKEGYSQIPQLSGNEKDLNSRIFG